MPGMIHFITITLLIIILGLSGINSLGMYKTMVSDAFLLGYDCLLLSH
jgi:hypothetical protein